MSDVGLLEHVEKDAPYEHFMVKPAQPDLPNDDDTDLFRTRKVVAEAVHEYEDVLLDNKSFPH
ncbi:MAG: hypothetical protein GY739_21125, partial [Mesoflavibacter sp.]|nr:hypothetical protein [Mesoflavibacter sp.]